MLTGWRLAVSKLFVIPQRWVVGVMGFLAFAVAYLLRVCLNICITQMVVPIERNETFFDPDGCIGEGLSNVTKTHGQYEWDETLQSFILGGFYYGYVISHLPGGLLAEKYGGKHILGLGILVTAVLTILTPLAVEYGGANALIAVRVVEGLAEGPTTPALASVMARWVPKNERGRMGSLIFGGAQIGNIAGMALSGVILGEEGNWPMVFYIFGSIGVVWFIFWTVLVYSDPNVHPFISDEEKTFLDLNIEEKLQKPIPWTFMLTSAPMWAIIIASIGHDWAYFTLVTDLPKYMVNVLKFDIESTGFLAALPYIVMWLMSFVYAMISDLMVKKEWASIKNVRKLSTALATIGPSIFIVGTSYVGCDPVASVSMICVAMSFLSGYYCGMKVNALDITPNYAGVATSVINGLGAISGIVTPYIVAIIAPQQTRRQWQVVFWIIFGVLWFTNIVYAVFAEGEEVWWNDVEKNGHKGDTMKKNRTRNQNTLDDVN